MSHQGIESLGLGQPMTHPETAHPQEGHIKEQPILNGSIAPHDPQTNGTTHTRPHAASEPTITGQEIPTTNPSVHVVITNPPTPSRTRAQTDSKLSPPQPTAGATRHRADTNASMRSFATSTTSASDMADDDDDEDDYDPSQGGDEKSCIKEKRVKEWRKRFHPRDDEELLCTHGCALVIEIMIHGRMYLSNKRICFRSNILGVRTKREIPLKHIHAIVLRNVAGMIPNSFEVHYNDKKYQFTTLPDRDHVLRILMRYWKQENPKVFDAFIDAHPEFSTYMGADVPTTTGGAAGRRMSTASGGTVGASSASGVGGEKGAQPEEQSDKRKDVDGMSGGPRAATRADTQDLEKVALDTVLPSEPEKIYKLLYHNNDFLENIWKEEGFKDIQMQPWSNGKREFQYARPVGSLGSTTCVSSETIVHPDGQDDWFCVEGKTQTPGVPSGKSFATRSKTVFTWAEGGGTKMHVTFQVDWTGRSMLKGTINSQSVSGQKHWNSLLAKKIREYVKAHPDEFPATKGAKAGVGEEEGAGDAGAGEEGLEAVKASGGNGQVKTTSSGEPGEPRDPLESLESQQTLLFEHGPIAYLADDPVRAVLLVIVLLFLLSWFMGLLKRALWTGKMVNVPFKRLRALEAAEGELRVLVGDVRGHLKRAAGAAGKVVSGTGTGTGVVGGTGKVVRRTALPEL